MITEKDLVEAIAECQGERNPNANTCIKLAAFYTIKNHMYPESKAGGDPPAYAAYSFSAPPEPAENTISYTSGSEFSRLIDGRRPEDVWPIIEELVQAVAVFTPRLYDSFLDRLEELPSQPW